MAEKKRNTAKVRVRRTKTGDDAITSFPYYDGREGDGTQSFAPDPNETEFDMTPAQARGAIATGAFEVSPDSKSTIEDAERDEYKEFRRGILSDEAFAKEFPEESQPSTTEPPTGE